MSKATRFAELSISSPMRSPEAITAVLGMAPDSTRAKGTKDRRIPQYDVNEWSLKEGGDARVWPPELVDRLIERVAPGLDRLRSLAANGDCTVHLSIWVVEDEDERSIPDAVGPDFCLEAGVIAWLASIGSSLGVELYLA